MSNPIQMLLAALSQGGGHPAIMGRGGLDVNGDPLSGIAMQAPQMAAQRVSASQGMAAPRTPQDNAPVAPSGLAGALGSMLMPKQAGRNQTIQWLQTQGMDPGMATLLASNKPALQKYLLDRSQGADPMDALKLEKTQLEIDQMRNPTTDDIKEYQFAVKQGYKGTLPEFITEMKKAGATNITNTVDMAQTKGRSKVDEKYAEDFVDWNARGAYADVTKQIDQLEEAAAALEGNDSLTGPVIGSVPDSIGALTNPKAIAVREMVEEVVQRNLRLVLGAQFTEKEGERLIARAYNPRLSEAENARRVRRLITQIKTAAEAKQSASEYFAKYGTLTGWGGRIPTWSDFDPEGGNTEQKSGSATGKGDRLQPSQVKRIMSESEYMNLPSGSTYIAPDGTTRRKP